MGTTSMLEMNIRFVEIVCYDETTRVAILFVWTTHKNIQQELTPDCQTCQKTSFAGSAHHEIPRPEKMPSHSSCL